MKYMATDESPEAQAMATENRRLQKLVAELLKKNERLRQQLVLLQPAEADLPQLARLS